LCKASGYRTDNLSARDSQMAKKMFENFRDGHTPETIPSGRDVIEAQQTVMTRLAQDKAHSDVVEDLRNVRFPSDTHISTAVRNEIHADIRRGTR
jgi:hypothetical protein